MKVVIFLVGLLIVEIGYVTKSMATDVADPPRACTSGRPNAGYRAGVASGRNLAEQAWSSVNNCDRIEVFATILQNNVSRLTLPPGSSDYVICRHAGIVAGVYAEVEEIWIMCDAACCSEGQTIGELAGKLYCDISIALGGLVPTDYLPREPVFTCGLNFETCCDGRFIGFTTTYVSPSGASCEPYTHDPFTPAFTQWREEQCIYTPPDIAVSEECTVEEWSVLDSESNWLPE